MDRVELSRMHFPVTNLGPGNRIGIWFQGCSLKCPGCISVDTWKQGKGSVAIEELYAQIDCWASIADGVTISGGEPFEQFEALTSVLQYLKNNHPQLSILVYTGFSEEVLEEPLTLLSGLMDALISEPFRQDEPSSHPWMGSANQRLHLFTARAHSEFVGVEALPVDHSHHKIDAMFKNDELWMTGILKPGALDELAKHLEKQGHKITHTQHSVIDVKRIE